MNKKKALRIAAWCLLAAVIAGGLWYNRPIDLYGLSPGMEVDAISFTVITTDRHFGMEDRSLRLEKGDPRFDEVLARLEALRFRRPPTNLLLQAMPFLEGLNPRSKTVEDGDISHLGIGLAQNGHQIWAADLNFWIDEWSYQDYDHAVSLPLSMPNSKETGQALARYLWEIAPENESVS